MKKEIGLEESKMIQLDILKSIDAFCRQNGIHYSLAAGSAIGAIRHKGFIPWDDDIDLIMLREEYNRFLSLYKDKIYNLLHYKTCPSWDSYYACVEDPRTETFWGGAKNSTRGIWVSVFPVDYVPDDERELARIIKKVQRYTSHNLIVRFKRSAYRTNSSFLFNLIKIIGRNLFKPIPFRYFYTKVDKLVIDLLNKPTNRLSSIAAWTFGTVFDYPAECFSGYIDVDFEGMKCMICKGYDTYLRKQYGDYMALPPLEQQVPKHEAAIFWKE